MSTEPANNDPFENGGILPEVLADATFIPKTHKDRYKLDPETGKPRLVWISVDDQKNMIAHLDAVAAGRVRALPAGENPYSMGERERQRSEMEKATWRELEAMEKREAQERIAAAERALARKKAEMDAQLEEDKKLLGLIR